MLLIGMGVGLTLASNIMSYSFHAYQTSFSDKHRSSAVGFVYSWSRFSAIFTSFLIAGVLKSFDTIGVFLFIAAAMLIVMAVIGLMGRARGILRWRDFAMTGMAVTGIHDGCLSCGRITSWPKDNLRPKDSQ